MLLTSLTQYSAINGIAMEAQMARVKKGLNAHKRHKKILKLAKGFYGAKSKVFRAANPAVMRSLASAYIGRKHKKRDFRRLWITRINAGARLNGLSYSKLMNGLKLSGIEINRKMLSEMAIADMSGFARLCETAKKAAGK
jgi:large subunit ribosomal protein L20